MKAPAQRRNSRVEPPPRPIHRPRLIDEHKSHQETSAPSSSASSHSQAGEGGKILSSSQTLPANTSNLRQDVFRVTICVFHSSLLIVSYIAGTTFLILLLPAFCISYCIRQIGLLLAQHRRSSLVETLSSLSLHYLHGEDAGRNIVVVIYLGAPGIKIATLKKLLVRRIFSAPPPPSNTHQRRNCGSKGMERWFAERLQQTVVPLPTGYAWQRLVQILFVYLNWKHNCLLDKRIGDCFFALRKCTFKQNISGVADLIFRLGTIRFLHNGRNFRFDLLNGQI